MLQALKKHSVLLLLLSSVSLINHKHLGSTCVPSPIPTTQLALPRTVHLSRGVS